MGLGEGGAARAPALLCFDEVQVSDPFTAVALKGVFEHLLESGAVLVMTSNRHPKDLNRHGLHEVSYSECVGAPSKLPPIPHHGLLLPQELFQHFVDKMLQHQDVLEISSGQDYRRARLFLHPHCRVDLVQAATPLSQVHVAPASSSKGGSGLYLWPVDSPGVSDAFERLWSEAAVRDEEMPARIPVAFGRTLEVPRSKGGSCRFQFEELCARNLGSPDYIALASRYHTVFVEGVPIMGHNTRDRARRFITLVDELYNHRCRLVCSAAAPPDKLFAGAAAEEPIIDLLESLQFETEAEGAKLRRDLTQHGGVAPVAGSESTRRSVVHTLGGEDEKFAFKRAVSRLLEMSHSPLYLAASRAATLASR